MWTLGWPPFRDTPSCSGSWAYISSSLQECSTDPLAALNTTHHLTASQRQTKPNHTKPHHTTPPPWGKTTLKPYPRPGDGGEGGGGSCVCVCVCVCVCTDASPACVCSRLQSVHCPYVDGRDGGDQSDHRHRSPEPLQVSPPTYSTEPYSSTSLTYVSHFN